MTSPRRRTPIDEYPSMSTFGRVPIGRGATACPATVEATHRPHRVHAPRHLFSTSRAAVAWPQRAPRPSRRAVRPASRIGVRARVRSATGPRRRKPSGSMGARNGVCRGAAESQGRGAAGPQGRPCVDSLRTAVGRRCASVGPAITRDSPDTVAMSTRFTSIDAIARCRRSTTHRNSMLQCRIKTCFALRVYSYGRRVGRGLDADGVPSTRSL